MQIIPELGPGGAEQGCIDMVQAITLAGGRAIVVSHGGTRTRMHELARAGGIHIDLPVHSKNPWVMWRNIRALQKLIVNHQVDIVHARSRAPAWSALEACKRTGIRFITTCHAPYNTQNEWKKKYNSSIARGERVIAISGYVTDYLRQHFGLGDDRIRLIHRGVALDKFHPGSVTPDRLIKIANEWRIPDGTTVILLPGRLTRWKGQQILIEAIAELERKDVFTVLVGSDQGRDGYTAELHKSIRDLGLEGRVRIAGHCDDMPAAYMLSHIVVSASIEPEGFGRVPMEGQAMGRMVIATNHGGARETVIDNVTGWLVPPGDVIAMAETLKAALALDPQHRAILGTNGMMNVAQNFTREKMMDQTLAVYNELLAG
jgi:glycosyltransferase involved in cell wall biosynthesis